MSAIKVQISDARFPGGGYSVKYVKRNIKDVKRDIRNMYSHRYYMYLIIHEHIISTSSSLIFINLIAKLGELIGENGWVIWPFEDDASKFRKQFLNTNLEKQISDLIRKVSDICILILEFPIDLYDHYPEESVTPILLLRFPKMEDNIQNYLNLFAYITYAINHERSLFISLKFIYGSKKSIIDCSQPYEKSPQNKFLEIYREKFSLALKDFIIKSHQVVESVSTMPETNENLKQRGDSISPHPPKPKASKEKKNSIKRSLKIARIIAAIIAFLAALVTVIDSQIFKDLWQKLFGK